MYLGKHKGSIKRCTLGKIETDKYAALTYSKLKNAKNPGSGFLMRHFCLLYSRKGFIIFYRSVLKTFYWERTTHQFMKC